MLTVRELTVLNGNDEYFAIEGDYLAILSTDYRGSFIVKTNAGDRLELKAGNEVKFEKPFKNLIISQSSILPVKLKIAVGGGGDTIKSNNVYGEVSVINGEENRVLSGQSFIAYQSVVGVAANASNLQIKNPLGSGVNVFVNKITAQSDTAGRVILALYDADLANNGDLAKSKLIGGGNSKALIKYSNTVSYLSSDFLAVLSVVVSDFKDFVFTEPFVLQPGKGLLLMHNDLNAIIRANFQFNEKAF